MRGTRSILTVFAALTLSACGGNALGNLGSILGTLGGMAGVGGGQQQQQQQQVQVEVQQVDPNAQQILVRTQNGERGAVLFDANTVVVYRQQQYPVTALERGDIVTLQLQQTQRNQLYVSRIDVVQSVQERSGMR